MVSQPAKAVILLFPITDIYEQKRREEDERIVAEGQPELDPTIFWMKQTVRSSRRGLPIMDRRFNTDLQCVWDHGPLACTGQCKLLLLECT